MGGHPLAFESELLSIFNTGMESMILGSIEGLYLYSSSENGSRHPHLCRHMKVISRSFEMRMG